MSAIIDAVLRLQDQFTPVLANASQKLDEHAKVQKRAAQEISRTGKSITDLGSKIALISAPLEAAAFAGLKLHAEFAAGMEKVSTLVDKTQVSVKELADGVRRVSDETGESVTSLAEAEYQAISAGVDTAHVTEFLDTVTKASIAGYTDATTAINGVTTVLNSYGMSASDASKITDEMLITQNLGKTTFGELSQSIGSVTPVAKQLNVTTEELFASLAALTKNGIQTPEAITGLRAALNSVIKPSSEASKAAQQLGIDFSAAHLQSVGWAKFMDEIKEKTGGNVEVMGQLFSNSRALTTMLSLTGQASNDFTNSLEAMSNQAGITERVFEDIAKNDPTRALKIAKNELANAGMDLGESLAPLLLRTSRAIKTLAEAIKSMSPEQKTLAMDVLQSVIVFGMFTAGLGKAVSMYGAFRKSALALAVDFNKGKGAMGLLRKGIEGIPAATNIARGALLTMGQGMVVSSARAAAAVRAIPASIVGAFRAIPTAIVSTFRAIPAIVSQAIGNIASNVVAAFRAVVRAPMALARGLAQTFTSVFRVIGTAVLHPIASLRTLFTVFVNGFRMMRLVLATNPIGLALLAITVVIGVLISNWRTVQTVATTVWNGVKSAVSFAIDAIRPRMSALIQAAQNVWQKLVAMWNGVTGSTSASASVVSAILNTLGATFNAVFIAVSAVVTGVVNTIAIVLTGLMNVLGGVIDFLTGVFTGNWSAAWDGIKEIVVGVVDTLEGLWDNFCATISGALDRIMGKAHETKEAASDAENTGNNWTGTNYFPGGVTWLHEQGPEIVTLPTGAQVIPHSESLKEEYRKGARDERARGAASMSIQIPKLADTIVVREENDIDKLTDALAFKLKAHAINRMEGAFV